MSARSEWIIDKTEAVSRDGMVTAMQREAAADLLPPALAEVLIKDGEVVPSGDHGR